MGHMLLFVFGFLYPETRCDIFEKIPFFETAVINNLTILFQQIQGKQLGKKVFYNIRSLYIFLELLICLFPYHIMIKSQCWYICQRHKHSIQLCISGLGNKIVVTYDGIISYTHHSRSWVSMDIGKYAKLLHVLGH